MLNALGWVLVVWLVGSTIYSIQFHLRNYFDSKKEVTPDIDLSQEIEESLNSEFLKRILIIQFVKLGIAFAVWYYFLQ